MQRCYIGNRRLLCAELRRNASWAFWQLGHEEVSGIADPAWFGEPCRMPILFIVFIMESFISTSGVVSRKLAVLTKSGTDHWVFPLNFTDMVERRTPR